MPAGARERGGRRGPGLTIGRPDGRSEVPSLDVPEGRLDEWYAHFARPLHEWARRHSVAETFCSSKLADVPIWSEFVAS